MSALIRNTPSTDGRKVGDILADMAEEAQPEYAADFAKDGLPVPQRCRTCAFRPGTFPNGCLPTTMDAFKCVFELIDFLCHDKDAETPEGKQICVGWAMCVSKRLKAGEGITAAPWPFSDEMEAKP